MRIELEGEAIYEGEAGGRILLKESTIRRTRIRRSAVSYIEDYIRYLKRMKGKLPEDVSIFTDIYINILTDERFMESLKYYSERYASPSKAVIKAFESILRRFKENSHNNEKLIAFSFEIEALKRDVLDFIHGNILTLENLNEPHILITRDLNLRLAFEAISSRNIVGVAVSRGSVLSHPAILLKSTGIPSLLNIRRLLYYARRFNYARIEGNKLILSDEPLALTHERSIPRIESDEVVKDGRRFKLYINLDTDSNIPENVGIGLLRTEYLLSTHRIGSHKEQHINLYRQISEKVYPKELVIRLLDIADDKANIFRRYKLKARNISYFLKHTELGRFIEMQIEAIVRANRLGNIKLLIPMVSTLEDLKHVKEIANRYGSVSIGIMVEVPSVIFLAKAFLEEADFFSIGTNDLLPNLLGIPRRELDSKQRYHPVIFKAIRSFLEANSGKKPVSVCGDLASDNLGIIMLASIGINEFSVNPSFLERARKILESVGIWELERIEEKVLSSDTTDELLEKVRSLLRWD